MNTNGETAPTRDQVLRLIRAGRSKRQVAAELGISTQRVYQHIQRLRDLGELPEEQAS